MSKYARLISRISLRKAVSIALITITIGLLVPEPVAAAVLNSMDQSARAGGARFLAWLAPWKSIWERNDETDRERKGLRPPSPQSKAEREAQVAAIELNVSSEIELISRQPMLLMAVPVDHEGRSIHGLRVKWESSDKRVIFVRQNGEVMAGLPGEATLSARVGGKEKTVRVRVVTGTKDPFGGKKRVDSVRRSQPQAIHVSSPDSNTTTTTARNDDRRRKRAHAVRKLAGLSGVMPFIRDPNDDPLPDNETGSLYEPSNLIGTPPGRQSREQ